MKNMTLKQNKRQNAKTIKSSPEARKLIRAVLATTKSREYPHGNQHQAAKILGLPNHAQLQRMLHGELRDTPAMKIALAQADRRAERAWKKIKPEYPTCTIDAAMTLKALRRELDAAIVMIDTILKNGDNNDHH